MSFWCYLDFSFSAVLADLLPAEKRCCYLLFKFYTPLDRKPKQRDSVLLLFTERQRFKSYDIVNTYELLRATPRDGLSMPWHQILENFAINRAPTAFIYSVFK